MLPLSSLLQGCVAPCCTYSLQIIGDFDHPEYCIGQLVWHRVKRSSGETLYPVQIIGLLWNGDFWEYSIDLPDFHPWFDGDEDATWSLSSYVLELL